MPTTSPEPFRRAGRLLAVGLLVALAASCTAAVAGASNRSRATPKLAVKVEPGATMSFLDRAVLAARHSVRVEMYELADATFEADLANRAAHRVAVDVLLDHRYSGASVNAAAFSWLRHHHVTVRWTNDTEIFHEKAVVIDASTAYVGTGNLESKYYSTTRDFWVIDTIGADVDAIDSAFSADWTGAAPSPAPAGADLVWSPGAEPAFLSFIASAKHSIYLESEEIDADKLVDALRDAAHRGVAVHVTMTYDSSWVWAFNELVAAGVQVHLYYGESPLYIHAKAICVDCTLGAHPHGTVLVGSQNLSTASLTYNRELSTETSNAGVVGTIDRVLRSDFAGGSPYSSSRAR